MELYLNILMEALLGGDAHAFRKAIREGTLTDKVENICFHAIQSIYDVLNNDTLSDFECIERIVSLLEGIGLNGGTRHDY